MVEPDKRRAWLWHRFFAARLMSKLAPKKYGDKLTAELGGIGGGAIKFEGMTDAELREQLAKDLALLQLPRE